MEEHKTHRVVIYNDDVNSFQYIMACLIRYCKQEPLQAEQCALLAHMTGKCQVKSGDFLEMLELKSTFDDLDIKSEIKEYASNMH